MCKKILFIFCLFIFCLIRIDAQVNLQKGSATFSLPMFNWQDDKSRLNSVIALDYNSGNGLKVDEVASNVGQGWNLIAGGVITRIQVGEPDDQKAYTSASPEIVEDENKYPAGYLENTNNAYTKGCPLALTKYPIFGDKNHIYKQHNAIAIDKELDYFSFQFNGRSGLFALSKNNSDYCLFLGESKLIGWFTRDVTMTTNTTSGIRTYITSFNIKDENGLIYKFTKHGLSKVLKTSYCDANLVEMQTQPKFRRDHVYHEGSFDKYDIVNPYIINSWYLTEIQDPLTSRVITINYSATDLSINNNAGSSISYFPQNNYSIISHRFSKTQVPQISSISYPDGHTVTFNYGGARIDLLGDFALSSVDISYQSRYLSRYQLNTSYFILNRYGTPVSSYQKSVARLCLLSVKKIGPDLKGDDNPYLFDYYMGSSNSDDYVPPPFCIRRDIWGFYNGDNSKAFNNNTVSADKSLAQLSNSETQGLCFMKNGYSTPILNPKDLFARNGLLRQIIYPTGGTLTYDYVQNKGIIPGQLVQPVGGVQVSKTSLTDGGYSNGCTNPIVTNYNYILSTSGNPPSMWGLEMPDNSTTGYNDYVPEYPYWHFKFPKIFGECSHHFLYPGILSHTDAVSITAGQQLLNVLSVVADVVSTIQTVIDVINLIGEITGPGAVIIDIITSIIDIGFSCLLNTSRSTTSTVYYNSDLNNINPLPVQFKRVEVVQGTGGIGKTVQEFTSSDDYPIWESSNTSSSQKQRYANWAYGLPKITTVFNTNGDTIKKIENRYNFSLAKRLFCDTGGIASRVACPDYSSCKCLVVKNYSQRNTDWSDITKYNTDASYQTQTLPDILIVDPYYIYTGRVEDTATYERTYKQNSTAIYLETVTKYQYNPYNYQVSKITTTQSNGDKNYQEIKYSSDYTSGILNTLNSFNIVALPVESTNSLQKNGSSTIQYLNEKVTEFTQLTNGDIKPSRVLEQRFAQPQSVFTYYSGPGSLSNPSYKETQSFTYNAVSGNLIGMKDEGNHIVTNIYDYNDKYIIASVINADPNLDKPAYTSFETANFGGWALTGTATQLAGTSITGAKYFALSAGKSFNAALNTTKPYKLSLWASTAVTVNVSSGSASVKSGPTISGFTYYEYDITAGAASVTVSGTANIDELRLYPKTARMRTVSYDEIIGKTSECDENNRITYYEYDELGRQKLIRDEYRNIVKMYEYNTVSNKQNGCPGTYSSRAISEIFTKSNCSAGYIGSNVIYTVPANKYSSLISQADADQKAENEINTSGQTNANSLGTCIQLFYNAAKSASFVTENCPIGYDGGIITYSVAAAKYTSTISQADADQMAQDEIDANGQSYANSITHRVCTLSTVPDWQSDNPQFMCEKDGTANTGHQLALLTDVNPNSSSFGTQAWKDVGYNPTACPATQYLPALQTNCPAINSVLKMYGNVGDVIVLTLSFSGQIQWNGISNGAGVVISVSAANQVSSNSSPHITNTTTTNFSTSCTITFTMPANFVTINTTAVINNSTNTTANSPMLSVTSINGVLNTNQAYPCKGTSGGSW